MGPRLPNDRRRDALNRPRTCRRPRPRFVSAAVAMIARYTTSEFRTQKPWNRGKVLEDEDDDEYENDSWRSSPDRILWLAPLAPRF